jgi:tetratricopeptide (TPR) repeat protein
MSSAFADPISPFPRSPPVRSKPPNSSDSDAGVDAEADANVDTDSDDEQDTFHDASTHFSPEDEAALLSESEAIKTEGNNFFRQKRYSEAISTYDRALSSCPNYIDYEIAVLKSNMAACHLSLEDWKNAIDSATEALNCLDRLHPLPKPTKPPTPNNPDQDPDPTDTVIELPSNPNSPSTTLLPPSRLTDINRIRIRALTRRALSRRRLATWTSLTGAQEDYTLLLSLLLTTTTTNTSSSSSSDATTLTLARTALHSLPAEINRAKDREMGEMMGKLRELGNGILKPFGLSTDNFKMVRDDRTGGYSMNFEQKQQQEGGGEGR